MEKLGKSYLFQIMLDKIFGVKEMIKKQFLALKENLDICLCIIFNWYCQNFIKSSPSFEVFLTSLTSEDPKLCIV